MGREGECRKIGGRTGANSYPKQGGRRASETRMEKGKARTEILDAVVQPNVASAMRRGLRVERDSSTATDSVADEAAAKVNLKRVGRSQ